MFKTFTLGSILIIFLFNNLFGVADARSVQLKAEHPAPGRMIDVGGYQLHIYCLGKGSPTVILDAGLGNPGLTWIFVQTGIKKRTRVCVYDRAGLGWSDPSPHERTAKVMVDELHTLLKNAGIEAPYILVGHSFGGLLMRLYIHRYPEEIAGLVLVDSYHYTQMEEYPKVNGKGNLLLPLALQALDLWVASGIPALDPSLVPTLDLKKLPSNALETYQALAAADPKSVREAQAELAFLEESGDEEKSAQITSLGNIPLIVLSHEYLEPRLLDPIGLENYGEYEIFWRSDQAELALLSPRGRLVIAPRSGHYIQLDQPDLVIGAIEQVLAELHS
jgi:pimeloyl-ACP methyl ester carboxylesterase